MELAQEVTQLAPIWHVIVPGAFAILVAISYLSWKAGQGFGRDAVRLYMERRVATAEHRGDMAEIRAAGLQTQLEIVAARLDDVQARARGTAEAEDTRPEQGALTSESPDSSATNDVAGGTAPDAGSGSINDVTRAAGAGPADDTSKKKAVISFLDEWIQEQEKHVAEFSEHCRTRGKSSGRAYRGTSDIWTCNAAQGLLDTLKAKCAAIGEQLTTNSNGTA